MMRMLEEIKEDEDPDFGIMFFSFLVASITGLFVGFILTKMLKIGAAIIGAVGGAFLSLTLYNLLFLHTDSKVLLIAMSIMMAVICAVVSFRFYE
jgi:membrane-bound ClpP family serine protease